MKANHLLDACVQVLKPFNQHIDIVEDYIQTYINHLKNIDEDEKIFIAEVFTGCVYYSKIINTAVNAFIKSKGTSYQPDSHLFAVLTYLIVFKLNELKLSKLKELLIGERAIKVCKFLNFFLDANNLTTIRNEWVKQYDAEFVKEKIMEPLLQHKNEVDNFTINTLKKLTFKQKNKIQKKSSTKLEPFNLTLCSSKPVCAYCPEPNSIKLKPRSLSFLKNDPKEYKVFLKLKNENYQKALFAQQLANKNQWRCANTAKSYKTMAILQNIIDEKNNQLSFNMKHFVEPPNSKAPVKPIQLNSATILREASLFQKEQENDLRKKHYIEGPKPRNSRQIQRTKIKKSGPNVSRISKKSQCAPGGKRLQYCCYKNLDFVKHKQLKEDYNQKEKREQHLRVHEKWIQDKINRKEAILARQKQIQEKKGSVQEMKEENKKKIEEKQVEQEMESKRSRDLILQVRNARSNIETIRTKVRDEKQDCARKLKQATSEMLKNTLKNSVNHLKNISAVIREKHWKENNFSKKQRFYDSTHPSTEHGISLAETKERLSLFKDNQNRLLDEKKDSILKTKQERTDAISTAIQLVAAHRKLTCEAKERRTIQKQSDLKLLQQELKTNESLQRLRDKLKKVTEEKIWLTKENKSNSKSGGNNVAKLIRETKHTQNERWRQHFDRFEREAMVTPATMGS